jgi:hypothetical protein
MPPGKNPFAVQLNNNKTNYSIISQLSHNRFLPNFFLIQPSPNHSTLSASDIKRTTGKKDKLGAGYAKRLSALEGYTDKQHE